MGIPIIKMATIGILPSSLKIMYYKWKGAKIGKNVSIGLFSIINAKDIEIGDYSTIGLFTFINCKKLTLGKRTKINMMVAIETVEVEVDNDSVIMEQVVVGGMLTPRSKLKIGKRVKIFPYSFLNPTEPITIEDDAGIGGANYIFTHGSWQSVLDGFPVSFGPVTIKKGVWFPWRVFVMPNVEVGEFATIGAGSVITKNIPAKSLAAGTPAKVLKTGDEYIKQYTNEEKLDIVLKIMNEMQEFFSFKYNIQCEQNAKRDTLFNFSIHQNQSITLFNNYTDLQVNTIHIFFNEISNSEMNKLNANGSIWFDILGKKTFFHKSILWNDVKDFFSRYGIRFEILS